MAEVFWPVRDFYSEILPRFSGISRCVAGLFFTRRAASEISPACAMMRFPARPSSSITFADHTFMKNIVTSILIGVALYFLYPIISHFISNHHLLVLAVTGGLFSYLVIS